MSDLRLVVVPPAMFLPNSVGCRCVPFCQLAGIVRSWSVQSRCTHLHVHMPRNTKLNPTQAQADELDSQVVSAVDATVVCPGTHMHTCTHRPGRSRWCRWGRRSGVPRCRCPGTCSSVIRRLHASIRPPRDRGRAEGEGGIGVVTITISLSTR